MGGREIESLIGLDTRQIDIKPDQPALLAAVKDVITAGAMLLPTFAPGTGPFPNMSGRWVNKPTDWLEQRTAVCLYAAFVTSEALRLIGSKDTVLIEGRFAEAEVFVRALASLNPRLNVYTCNAHNDVSFGALKLMQPRLKPQGSLTKVTPLDEAIDGYHKAWRSEVRAFEGNS